MSNNYPPGITTQDIDAANGEGKEQCVGCDCLYPKHDLDVEGRCEQCAEEAHNED